jgi:hypothetical protein
MNLKNSSHETPPLSRHPYSGWLQFCVKLLHLAGMVMQESSTTAGMSAA